MDMDSQPSTEIKAASSQYHDNDLVDMNELILDNWNLGADNEAAALQCSQEIKLESYNFLGNRINYEEENFQLDEYPSPENYFKGERNAHQYESEDDEDRQINGVMEITDDHVNGVIEIADESSRDSDVVNLLNSSDEVHNASNLSISANLESIRSDHNYSSQELFAPSLNETIDRPEVPATEPETEPMQEPIDHVNEMQEPIDHVNEMQALIASWMHGSSSESKVTILNNLESEIKRIKETVLDIPKPEPSPKTPTNASKDDATPIDANTSIISEDNESDSGYIMSEGHSEPLEYRGDRAVLTESETATEKIDEVPVETLKDLRSVSEEVVAKIGKFSKLCSSGTSRLTDLTECGNDVIKSVVAMAAILKLEIGGCTHEKVTVATDEPTGNLGDANDEAEREVDDSGDKTADERSIDETVGQMVSENGNDGENFPEIVDSKVNGNSDDKIEDDENVDAIAVVEDKQKQLDLKSKKRWLASSSEDSQHSSDDSYSENLPVKRRKKRARTKSSSSSSSSDVTSSSINLRKKNVLLESSDDDQSQNGAASSVELDEVPSSEKDAVKDVDMSNYLLPLDVPVNKSMDSDIGDDIDDANDQRVDSEVEEFFGFDGAESTLNIIGPTSDISIDEATGDGVGNISEPDAVESTCDNIETTSNVIELAFDASEPTGDVVEQNSDVTEHTTDVTEQTTDVTEQISDVTEQTSDITEQTSDVTEQTSDVIEPTCDVTEPTSDVIEPTSDVIEGTSDVTEQISDATEPTPDDLQQTSDVNEPVIEHTFDGTERTSEIEEIIDSKTPYVQSQQWELPEELNYSDSENDEAFERNISPKKEVDVENDLENHNEHAVENEDLKAENVDDENDNGENHQNEEYVSECDTDDEIDRLIDFSNIPTKVRPVVNHVPVYRKKSVSKPKPKEDILDILKDSASQDIESESSSEEDIISEEQFVLQLARQQCLKDSSDSDGQNSESVDDDDDDDEDKSSIDNVTDESNDSKVDRFLKKQLAHEMENHLDDNEKPEENAPAPSKDIPVEEDDVDEVKDEQDLELQSSGIFEPEIELHDGEKPPDKDEDSDAEETLEQKAPEEKKKWKLDKIAFSKNLFSNLDLDDDKNTKATANSDNSDCEMLDISMFKTKKSDGDLDKIIQNQKKRDVSKISSSKVADECISLSSDSDLEIDKGTIDEDSEDEKPTTKSRPMLRNDQLAGETKQAQKEENDRLKRLEKKTERLTQIVESQTEKLSQSHDDSDVILDFDSKQNCAISVHPEIVKNLKEHQIAGVKFMYDCCYGSVDSIEKHNGSGCILAHCMGLGKTLQLIALLHTLIRYPQLKTKKILVICPKSTIMNWADEIQTWLQSVKVKLKVLHFPDPSDINKKLQILREWHSFKADPDGKAGCMLIGYEAFRSLVFYADKSKPDMSQVDLDRIRKMVEEYLLKPGADLVVCDEGHVIKNRKSTTSRAVNKISSRRRIILTGTPIQNNLKEYYSMVNFIKPSFLGTEKEFANLYENPIKEGQHKDSNSAQIRIMKQRSYVLHKKLSKFVQRREAALLKTFLPEKYEYVLFIPMTELQNRLYQHFLDNNPLKERYGGKSLIPDYTFLRKIWTHPKVLENAWKNAIALRDKRNAARRRNMDSDEEPDDVLDSQVGKMSVENDWWRQFIEPMDLRSLLPSNKLRILFEILKLCEQNREKCLIFSAFVAVLDVVEFFMHQIHNKVSFNDGSDLGIENFHGPWEKNHDYYRLDGKTSKALRHAMIRNFNNPGNERVKCFLISAKAGGQGINLVGANRVILLDTSWNPSNDQQNIFRVFRLGQQSKCYIYRLLAMGTMEEKVYSRSVTKQAMSFRVVDEQQIDRHYSLAELAELYTLTKPDPAEQPTPVRPVDNILASLLRNFKSLVYKYHEHDSLLENNSAEDLNEQEKADAWEAYEKDVSMKNQFGNMNITADGTYGSGYGSFGLGNLMNPYSYIPPNLPTSMIPAYLQRMGYTGVSNVTGVEQELMLMSQMYSQFNQSGGTSAYGPLSSYFNSPSSSSTNPLYNSPGASNNYYKSTTNSTSTTSSPTSYSNISSSVFNGLNQLTSSSSSAVAQYNLARYMPSYSGNPSYSPFNMYPTSASATSTNAAQSLATNQPGPNAIKNPLLSNLLPPSTSITKDSFSIPTSVITKASKDVQRAAANTSIGPVSSLSSISLSSNTSQSHQKTSTHSSLSNSLKGNQLMVARASPLSSARSSPLSSARVSPLSSARASPLSSARASPLSSARISPLSSARASPSIASRSSPSINRTSADGTSSLSISRTSATAHKNSHNNASLGPLSITLASNRTSPEPNLIVKDVSAINRSMERKTATTTSKAPAQPIKNFNMGIVYPKAPEKKAFDLSQNDSLLKAAKSQLQQNARPEPQNRISLPPSPSRTANRLSVNRIHNLKSGTRTATTTARAMDTNVSSSSLTSIAKNHLSSPNLPTNEVTITPTKRPQKLSLPMSAINAQRLASTALIGASSSHKSSPIEINKLNNSQLSVSRVPSSTSITRQLPATSSANASITRQIPNPSSVTNANKITGRLNPPKSIPKFSNLASTMPTLKLISTPSNSNNKTAAGVTSRPVIPAINRNPGSRVVAANNGVKVAMQRPAPNTKVFTASPAPKLVSFTNPTSSSDRKRKLEELIPKNTGVTLIKKPKPREPVEIVELD